MLRDLIVAKKPRFGHPDLLVSRIKRDERYVTSVEKILEKTWTNPFCSDPVDLVSISTRLEEPLALEVAKRARRLMLLVLRNWRKKQGFMNQHQS